MDVVVVKTGYGDAAAGIGFFGLLFNVFGLYALVLNGVRDIFHGNQEGDREARAGDFLVQGFGPEAVHEVIVLIRGKALDAAVAAVMVGDKEALVTYHLSGAAATKVHDGILEGGFIDGVNLFRGKLAACRAEVFSVELFEERQKPHAFIGHGRK